MATVKEISQDIKDTFGSSFINKSQAGLYLGMWKGKCAEFLANVPCYPTGREIKYHALDIARYMAKIQTYKPYG